MKVVFSAEGVRAPAVEAEAEKAIQAVLRRGRVKGVGELNVVWVSRRKLRSLGKKFRRADKFTDVISFRYDGKTPAAPGELAPFGDLYISPDEARVNAARFGASHAEECLRLCVHGALHLLGYTDYDAANKKRMWAAQEPVVRRFSRAAPRGRR